MRHELPALLLALLLLVATACSGQPDTQAPLARTQAGLSATLALTPESPAAMRPVQLLLTLRDTRNAPVDGVRVTWDLTMPGMAMPENAPRAASLGEGRYRAEAIFTMSGKWRAEATVTRPEGAATFSFDITVP